MLLSGLALGAVSSQVAFAGEPATPVDSAIKAFVKANMSAVRSCYEGALRRDPKVAGRVEVAWTLDAGRVTATRVVEDTTGDATLSACIDESVRGWVFPADLSGEYAWPFVFKASAR